MFGYVYYSPSSPGHRTVEVSHPSMLPATDSPEDAWLEVPSLPARQWMAVAGTDGPEVVPFERPPEIALMLAKQAKRLLVEEWRDMAEWSGCMTPKGRVQTDAEKSQRKIAGLVQMATLAKLAGNPFSADFTMANNIDLAHDADEMIALGVAVGVHVQTCHAIMRDLKAEVDAAETIEEVEAIVWPVA